MALKLRESPLDCVIVGAGPAGLTAAVYLARFRRSVLVVHDGLSRALRIPRTYNVPGFPDGVVGQDLVDRMIDQAQRYGAQIKKTKISRIGRSEGHFEVHGAHGVHRARTVILATGICLHEVDLPHDTHEAAIAAGCLRYCPICDGFEAAGKRIGVLGCDSHGVAEALFLRHFSDDVTLVAREKTELTSPQKQTLAAAGIAVVENPLERLEPGPSQMTVRTRDDQRALEFDVLYPALGCSPRSELAADLKVDLTDAGCIPTDATQHTNVPGVFAAGDVVEAMDQISVAIGHGAIAATHAHKYLTGQG